jgi:hypothetical protein
MRDDSDAIRSEYADACRLEVRMAISSRAADAALDAVAEVSPARVLDVGAGPGEFALRVAATGACRSPTAHFDCVVANWMLYHVADRDRARRDGARPSPWRSRRCGDSRHVEWHIEFTDRARLDAIVGATIRRSHLAPGVLRLGMPFKATARNPHREL